MELGVLTLRGLQSDVYAVRPHSGGMPGRWTRAVCRQLPHVPRGGLAAGAHGRAGMGLPGGLGPAWAVRDPGQEPGRQHRAVGRAVLAACPVQQCGVLPLLLWFQKQAC